MRNTFGFILVVFGWCCIASTVDELRSEEPTIHNIPAFQIVITVEEQRTTLLDQGRREFYSTDHALVSNRLEKYADGSLSYKTQHGDRVQVDADGGRLTRIESLGVAVHEWVNGDQPVVDTIAISEKPEFAGRAFSGAWRRTTLLGRTWVSNNSAVGLPTDIMTGDFELLDTAKGTLRFADDQAHFRGTYYRDGTSRREYLNESNAWVRRSIETFPAGNELDRQLVTAEELAALKNNDGLVVPAGASVERVHMILPDGYIRFRLIETVIDGQSTVQLWTQSNGDVSRRVSADQWVYRKVGESFGPPQKYHIERLDGQTFRFQFDRDHLRKTMRTDGSSTIEFLEEISELSPDLTIIQKEVAGYTLESDANAGYQLTDSRGHVYREFDVLGGDLLTVDETRQKVTFVDDDGRRITLATSGERTLVDADGNQLETDSGGRMIRQRDPAGKIIANYNYTEDVKTGEVELTSYENSSGFWERTLLHDRVHKWDLMNGKDGATATLDAEFIAMNRQNSMVMESKGVRTISKLDGTVIVQTKKPLTDGGSELERKVGARQPGAEELTIAYVVKTVRAADGKLREQHFSSIGDGHVICQYDQTDGTPGPWQRVDGDKLETPSSSKLLEQNINWRGYFAIDENGTLIKHSYAAPTGETVFPFKADLSTKYQSSSQPEAVSDSDPIVPHTVYVLTNGTSRQVYDDGREINRDRDGDIFSLRKSDGRCVYFRFRIVKNNSQEPHKTILEVEENGRRWKLDYTTGKFRGTDPLSGLDFGDSAAYTSINNRTGAIDITDLSNGLGANELVGVSLPDGRTRLTDLSHSYIKWYATSTVTWQNSATQASRSENATETLVDLPMCSATSSVTKVTSIDAPFDSSSSLESGDVEAIGDSTTDGSLSTPVIKGMILSQTAADGTLAHYIDSSGIRYDVDIDSPNDIEHCQAKRINVSTGLVIAVAGYDAPPDRPLSEDAIVGVTDLSLSGWGTEKHIVCVNAQGRLMRIWPDRSSEEYELAGGGRVRRITLPSGRIYSTVEAEAGEKRPDMLVAELSPWTGEGLDRSFECKLASNERMRVYWNTAWLLFDVDGQLKESLNSRGRSTDYTLPPEQLAKPEDFGKQRDRIYGPPTVAGATGHRLNNDYQWIVEHVDKLPDSTNDRTVFEIFEFRNSTRQVLDRDGAMNWFDADGRLKKKVDADGDTIFAEYDEDSDVPSRIKSENGTWTRSSEPVDEGGPNAPPVFRWTNPKERFFWDGDVPTALSPNGLIVNSGMVASCIDGDIINEHHLRVSSVTLKRRGTRVLTAVDAMYRETTYQYDSSELLTKATVKKLFGGQTIATYEVGVGGVKALSTDRMGQVKVTFDSGRTERRLASGAVVVMSDLSNPEQITEVLCPNDARFYRGQGITDITLGPYSEVHAVEDSGFNFDIQLTGTMVYFADNGQVAYTTYSESSPGMVEYEWSDDQLVAVTKSSSDQYGNKYAARFDRVADGTWKDDARRQYQGMRLNRRTGDVMFYADNGRTVLNVSADGEEIDARYDRNGGLRSSVKRDPLGRPIRVQDVQFNRTHLVRNADGELTRIIQGDQQLVKMKDNSFLAMIAPDLRLLCEPQVNFTGEIVWRGILNGAANPGKTRTVRPDGTIEICRLDGATETVSGDRSLKTFRYASGNEVAEVTVEKEGGRSVTLGDGTMIRQAPFTKRLEFLNRDGGPQLNADGTFKTVAGALAVSHEGHLTIDDREARTLTVCFADGKRLQYQQFEDKSWQEVTLGYRYADRTGLIRALGAMEIATPRPSNDLGISDTLLRNSLSSLYLGLEIFAPRSVDLPTSENGARHWQFDAGVDPPVGTYVTEVVAYDTELVNLIRSDGTAAEAYPGSAGWPKVYNDLKQLDRQLYSSRQITYLLDQLTPRYHFAGVQAVAPARQQSLWDLAWDWMQNNSNTQTEERGNVLARRAYEAGVPAARSVLRDIIDISSFPATTKGVAPDAVTLPRSPFNKRKVDDSSILMPPVRREPFSSTELKHLQRSVQGDFGPGPVASAASQLKFAAEYGTVEAQSILADMYENGHGVEKDLEKAAQWREKAAGK